MVFHKQVDSFIYYERSNSKYMTQQVGYARTSTGKQEIENQLKQLRERGITKLYVDEGVSGMKSALNRPDFKRMINDLIATGDKECIVWVFEVSRIGRDWIDSINTFIDLERKGILFYSISETWTQTSSPEMRKLLLSIVSWINEQEIRRLSDRVKAGLERAKAEGKILGRPFKNVSSDLVSQMLNDGQNRRQIADKLNVGYSTVYRRELTWKKEKLGR
jgi:putative DNA-invertase from lambdoid prophage Rac